MDYEDVVVDKAGDNTAAMILNLDVLKSKQFSDQLPAWSNSNHVKNLFIFISTGRPKPNLFRPNTKWPEKH